MMPWRRHRKTEPGVPGRALADAWQVISLLLDYPDERLVALVPVLRESASALPPGVGDPIREVLDHVERTDLTSLQADYVDTFDVTRRCALHMTYFLHGDTRKRGVALVQFKQAYRAAGVELDDEDAELPDHLCVLLEFGATCDADTAWKLLNDHRVGIELLYTALTGKQSPWLPAVRALRATLPQLQGDDEQALARLIAQGPPQEDVGIDTAPYAQDPALDEHLAGAPRPAPPSTETHLGSTIPVGAPR
ncbi:nitrate reductase molybdenum cofactor assembly chaperone [Janibacter limosus]|uniref:nitrate reductase molybdenum cofactor assembly chaperone n=1 Tax=Janibacter limosus TaxID=53458 RepID=UPI0008360EFD|nr:nitrate reductase molybdenum cofactor assembly chaperone [Janibacter limosus]